MFAWILRHSEKEKEIKKDKAAQSNTTQHKSWDNFFQGKGCTQVGLERTPSASRFLDVMLYQLSYWGSWLSSKSPIQTKAKQSKARQASQPDKQVNSY